MRRFASAAVSLLVFFSAGCGNVGRHPSSAGAGGAGGSAGPGGAGGAAGSTSLASVTAANGTTASTTVAASSGSAMTCSANGNPGVCVDKSACPTDGDHTPVPGYCTGAANIECCVDTPDTADNPAVPSGWVLMMQSEVTPAMTNWAVMILHDPANYPMYSSAMQMFGAQLVMAVVQWHPPDFNNNKVHRGVTLYKPSGG